MSKKEKRPKAKRDTWTFQPSDDVRKMVEDYLKANPEKDRTELLNTAIKTNRSALRFNSLGKSRVQTITDGQW